MNYTPAQEQAINKRGDSILLSAGAGSGKTRVLVERIIKMIAEEKVSADKLLVVTFTKAAAGEMKNRIAEALYQKLAENPHSAYLNEQCLLLNNAAITTIHSFCLDLVREYYYLLDIDANMKVANEVECQLLKEQALDDYLEFKYQQNDNVFRELLERYGGSEDENIRQIIFSLYEQAIAMPDYESWLKNLGKSLADTEIWLGYMQNEATVKMAQIIQLLQKAVEYCQMDDKSKEKYLPGFISDLTLAEKGADQLQNSLDAFIEFTDRQEMFNLTVRKNQKAGEYYNQAVSIYREAKNIFADLQASLANAHSSQAKADLAEIYPFVRELGLMTYGFGEYYEFAKCQKNILDFDDMGHLALELLYDKKGELTLLAKELKERYEAVLIDEYQDTNDLQEKVMLAVSREDNYFMVGDIKQSIYSFRMANPSLFKGKYDSFKAENKIDMNKNFRSRANIVTGTNDLFTILMPGGDENPAYKATAMMEFGAEYYQSQEVEDQPLKVWSIAKNADDKPTEDDEEEEKKQEIKEVTKEAQVIAQEIKRLIRDKQPIYDKQIDGYRPICYKDMVIIMRAPTNGAGEIYDYLTGQEIPCYLEKKSGYFSSWEVQITLDLLKILDNPQQDLPLAAVLRAPFIGFTNYSDEELLTIRQLSEQGNLYDCLEKAAEDEECGLKEKAKTTLQMLAQFRTWAVQCSLSELLNRLFLQCHLLEYAAILPNGLERRNNLEALYDKALQYEQTNFHGLFMFLDFIEQMQKKNQNIEPAPLIGENVDVVRIMSIHQSKGLEFPVVFLPLMSKKFFAKDYTAEVLLDKNLGLILPNVDLKERVKYPTVCTEVLKNKKKEALLAEEKRILYVAMTRAREILYFIGQEINPEEDKEQSYMDWLNILKAKQGDLKAQWEFKSLDVSSEEEATEEKNETEKDNPPEDEALKEALSWLYPYQGQVFIPTKTSVSAVNNKKMLHTHFVSKSDFSSEQFWQNKSTLSAAEKGTIMHRIISEVDLKKEIDLEYLKKVAEDLISRNIIPANSLDEIDLKAIDSFFQSPLGERMRKNKLVYREKAFTLPLKIADETEKPCTILIQGIIDCMWLEEDGWVLVDYKSNHVPPAKEEEFVQSYYSQLKLYAQAIEQIWQEPLKETYLYLLNSKRAIEVKTAK